MGIKAWITVNGNHIPIMDGESKMQAVGRFIKDRRKDKKDKVVKSYMEDHKNKSKEYAEGLYDDTRKKFGLQRTIKGRAETKEGYEKYSKSKHEFIEKYADKTDEISQKYVNNALANLREHNKYYAKGRELQRGKYKLKADNYKLSSAENKLQDFAQVSKSSYNISNIKAEYTPKGNIHIMTKDGKDISTVGKNNFTASEIRDLKKKGILK